MANERRVAVDTCVLVNIFTAGANDDPSWLVEGQRLLRYADAGEFRLVAATLVLAEVAGTGTVRGTHVPSKERRERIAAVRAWMNNHRRWLMVELDDRLAHAAGELAIAHQLKGPDAAILASAIAAKADTLVTWDGDLLKLNGTPELSIEITTPAGLRVSQQIFDID